MKRDYERGREKKEKKKTKDKKERGNNKRSNFFFSYRGVERPQIGEIITTFVVAAVQPKNP